MRSGSRCDRDMFDILYRGHLSLRNLHLNLISHAGFRVGPVIRRYEPTRRGRGQERAAHAGRRDPELSGTLAIHVDVYARVVQWFVVLNVAERMNLPELATN